MQQEADVIQDPDGNAISGAAVTVIDKATGELADLFADNETTSISNPVYTDANGRYSYKAKNGKYRTSISIGGRVFKGKDDVLLYDPVDDESRPITALDYMNAEQRMNVFLRIGSVDVSGAVQKAHDYANEKGGGRVLYPLGKYRFNSPVYLHDNTKAEGSGIGATVILHPSSHAFRNSGRDTVGNSNITIEGFSFDGGGTWDGALSMVGVRNSIFRSLDIGNIKPTGVTVGIGIGAAANNPSYGLSFEGIYVDAPDYCVVLDSSANGEIYDVTFNSCKLKTHWGSAISIAKNVRKVTITGGTIDMPADSATTPLVGVGIKMWEGLSVDQGPRDITISGVVFEGAIFRQSLQAISAANWTRNLSVTGCTFRLVTYAFYNNFSGTGAANIAFTGNVVENGDYGFYNDTSSDVKPTIVGCIFRNLTCGIRTSLNRGVIGHNKFEFISGKAVHINAAEMSRIDGNNFAEIGEEAVFFAANGGSNELNSLSCNTVDQCCTKTDNTYSVFQLNDQAASAVGNMVRNDGANRPKYIFGSAAGGNNRVYTGNWMFGARQGYREVVGANDEYFGNKERGGIG